MYMNREIAKLFRLIAQYLYAQNIAFKPQAYERAAQSLEIYEKDVSDVYHEHGLKGLNEIPGVGTALAEKIQEYIRTKKIKQLEQLKKQFPFDMASLSAIEGIGPKTALKLYKTLKVKTLADLERALAQKKLEHIKGFGKKTQEKLATHVAFSKKSAGTFLLGAVYDDTLVMRKRMARVPCVRAIEIAGSIRRMKETVHDIDMLAVSENPKALMDYFVSLPTIVEIYAKGITKSSVRLESGIDVDLRVVPSESWGAALNYFTGSKEHNVALREIAISKGWKLNEYGLFKIAGQRGPKRGTAHKEIMIAGKTEEELYEKLGMDYIEPEMRENQGEIEMAQKGTLPELVKLQDINGDLQMHSTWSDGKNTIQEMAMTALQLGYAYIAITDHTKSLGIAAGMDERQIIRQMKEIDLLNKKLAGTLRILKGLEVNILKNGLLDIPDVLLAKMDMVGAAVHSHFSMSKRDMTERVMRAMKNPHVDILFHPTGRLLLQREGYELDFEKVFACAKQTKTAIEINAFPNRLDVNANLTRMGKDFGILFSLGTDSHTTHQLDVMRFGVGVARRGWLEAKNILNTKLSAQLIAFLQT